MPFVGFIGDDGRNYSVEDALAASKSGSTAFASVPYALLKGIADSQQDRGDGISATSVLHCLRNEYLVRREPWYARPESLYAAFRGTLFHGLLERNAPSNARVEERHRKLASGIEISGQFDSLTVFDEGERADGKRWVISDWKTTKELPKYGAYSTHVAQVNIYRWLLGLPVEETRIEVWYFSMEGYKQTVLKDGSGRSGVSQMWDDEKVESYLTERLIFLRASLDAGIPMPYVMVAEDEKWLCPYCPVRARCSDLADKEREATWRRNAGLPPLGTPADLAPGWTEIVAGVLAKLETPDADRPATTGGRKRSAGGTGARNGTR